MLLQNNTPEPFTADPWWYVGMIVLLVILISPWIFIIFKYWIFRKLRVRFIIGENEELTQIYLKKGEKITLPIAPKKDNQTFIGWFIDQELTEEYIDMPMPNYNIKLYAKYENEVE